MHLALNQGKKESYLRGSPYVLFAFIVRALVWKTSKVGAVPTQDTKGPNALKGLHFYCKNEVGVRFPFRGRKHSSWHLENNFSIFVGLFWEYRHYGCAGDCKSLSRKRQVGSIPSTPTKRHKCSKVYIQSACRGFESRLSSMMVVVQWQNSRQKQLHNFLLCPIFKRRAPW